jgi:carbon starvation protein
MVPVWSLLQPRGAIGEYFLYSNLAVAAIGLIFGNFHTQYPAFTHIKGGLMAFTTFVYDTIDVCTRLGRYILWNLLVSKVRKEAC